MLMPNADKPQPKRGCGVDGMEMKGAGFRPRQSVGFRPRLCPAVCDSSVTTGYDLTIQVLKPSSLPLDNPRQDLASDIRRHAAWHAVNLNEHGVARRARGVESDHIAVAVRAPAFCVARMDAR